MPTRRLQCYWTLMAVIFGISIASAADDTEVIPPAIVEATKRWIAERVGLEFLDRYYRYLPEHSQRSDRYFSGDKEQFYTITWSFEMPDCTDVVYVAEFDVGLDGKFLWEPTGVPDCRSDPGECEIQITREQAIGLAERANFGRGLEPWNVYFGWGEGTFVWQIFNKTFDFGDYCGGAILLIDANDGTLAGESTWYAHAWPNLDSLKTDE